MFFFKGVYTAGGPILLLFWLLQLFILFSLILLSCLEGMGWQGTVAITTLPTPPDRSMMYMRNKHCVFEFVQASL
jgi:hypothetical protein